MKKTAIKFILMSEIWLLLSLLLLEFLWFIVRLFAVPFDYRVNYPQDGYTEYLYFPYEKIIDAAFIILGSIAMFFIAKGICNLQKNNFKKWIKFSFIFLNVVLFVSYETYAFSEKLRLDTCLRAIDISDFLNHDACFRKSRKWMIY